MCARETPSLMDLPWSQPRSLDGLFRNDEVGCSWLVSETQSLNDLEPELVGARRLRQGADLGAQAKDQGRNHAVDDVLDPGVRVDLGVMDEHSSNWDDSHRRIAIDEYTSAPFDDDMLNGGHAANASPGGWGWFAVQGYDDIQHSQLFDEQVCP